MLLLGALAASCSKKPKAVAPVPAPTTAPAAPSGEAPGLKLGVILSQSGDQSSASLLEGIRIAATEHTGHRVELLVRDDSGKAPRAAALMRELEADGVVGIVGPLRMAPYMAAVKARVANDLVMVVPALTEPLREPNAYAMNREDTAGAVLLGRYAASLKLRAGVIYEAGITMRANDASAFANAYTAAAGTAPTSASFTTGATTFATQIRRLRDARVQIVYLPLSATVIPQLVPQLGYYGLDKVQILGGEAWTADALQRSVQKQLMEGVVVSTILPRNSTDVAWKSFEAAYQQTYRRSLTNVMPGLGYDAARMILQAAPRGNVNRADIARGITRAGPIKGATGVLRVRTGAVTRTPFLMRYHNGVWEQVAFTGAQ